MGGWFWGGGSLLALPVMAVESAGDKVPEVATSRYVSPLVRTLYLVSVNWAYPDIAEMLVVPVSVPVLLASSSRVTVPLKPVSSTCVVESTAMTRGWGVSKKPFWDVRGWLSKTSLLATTSAILAWLAPEEPSVAWASMVKPS